VQVAVIFRPLVLAPLLAKTFSLPAVIMPARTRGLFNIVHNKVSRAETEYRCVFEFSSECIRKLCE
jgi:hypothetical protein